MSNTIYTEADYTAIVQQQRKRWLTLGIFCALFLVVLIISLIIRLEWLTTAATIFIGVLLIAGYDLSIKPLRCYEKHLTHSLHGRTRTCDLPFLRISADIDVVDGVRCHQLFCSDVDGKGRPYERLFYFDVEKAFPEVKEGDMLHIVHYDLFVADVHLA